MPKIGETRSGKVIADLRLRDTTVRRKNKTNSYFSYPAIERRIALIPDKEFSEYLLDKYEKMRIKRLSQDKLLAWLGEITVAYYQAMENGYKVGLVENNGAIRKCSTNLDEYRRKTFGGKKK